MARSSSPAPLRCFRCQQYGHHQDSCRRQARCGVCAGPHLSEPCIARLKAGLRVTALCVNCGFKHHCWNRRCSARRNACRNGAVPQDTHASRPATVVSRRMGVPRPTPAPPARAPSPATRPASLVSDRMGAPTAPDAVPANQTLTRQALGEILRDFADGLASLLGRELDGEQLQQLVDRTVLQRAAPAPPQFVPRPLLLQQQRRNQQINFSSSSDDSSTSATLPPPKRRKEANTSSCSSSSSTQTTRRTYRDAAVATPSVLTSNVATCSSPDMAETGTNTRRVSTNSIGTSAGVLSAGPKPTKDIGTSTWQSVMGEENEDVHCLLEWFDGALEKIVPTKFEWKTLVLKPKINWRKFNKDMVSIIKDLIEE